MAGPPYGNPARDVEQLAVLAVRTWLGDRGEVTDTSVGHDIDFRIEYRDGRLGIGEVGWHADAEIEAMWGNTFRQERQQVVELPAGSGTWSLGLQRGANIKRLYAKLPSLIALLRAAGLRRLEVVGPFPRTAAGDEARRLGIGYITEHDATGEPLCIYFMPSGGGSFSGDANVIVDWAEEVLDSKEYADTTAKLLRLNADERHVFLMTGSACVTTTSLELVNKSIERVQLGGRAQGQAPQHREVRGGAGGGRWGTAYRPEEVTVAVQAVRMLRCEGAGCLSIPPCVH
ncbi:MAG: hypothetical protein ABSG36_19845 [Acidimicrobiales bacterium]